MATLSSYAEYAIDKLLQDLLAMYHHQRGGHVCAVQLAVDFQLQRKALVSTVAVVMSVFERKLLARCTDCSIFHKYTCSQ